MVLPCGLLELQPELSSSLPDLFRGHRSVETFRIANDGLNAFLGFSASDAGTGVSVKAEEFIDLLVEYLPERREGP